MRVGVYSDLRNPPGWERPWGDLYAQALDRIAWCEEAGFDSAWLTEHHMYEDGYLPQPLTFAAAVACRTSRIRIGTGILLAPLRPAIDIAEQAAIVDILSNGRLELGLGAGYQPREFEAFGVDMQQRLGFLEQRARDVYELWATGRVTPPPLQDPVPLWIGVTGPRGAQMAGTLGAGLLWLRGDLLAPYRDGLARGNHNASSARMGGLVNVVLSLDPERTWAALAPFALYQAESYRRYTVEGTDAEEAVSMKPLDASRLRSPGPAMHPPFFDVVTPSEAFDRIDAWLGGLPVSDVFFWDSVAGMPESFVDEHLGLLASQLIPLIRKRWPT
jgi:alkanesulfonate monooxygenase SsuD/methylene tetrahydromethanopterin reductase-like flavin-dependent oxidoreductase (luciferase family)